jgi:hypothetical protein
MQRSFPELGGCLVVVALDNLVNGLAHFVQLYALGLQFPPLTRALYPIPSDDGVGV